MAFTQSERNRAGAKRTRPSEPGVSFFPNENKLFIIGAGNNIRLKFQVICYQTVPWELSQNKEKGS